MFIGFMVDMTVVEGDSCFLDSLRGIKTLV